eukprot:8160148-Pyramimonas_sp.AAC.1
MEAVRTLVPRSEHSSVWRRSLCTYCFADPHLGTGCGWARSSGHDGGGLLGGGRQEEVSQDGRGSRA